MVWGLAAMTSSMGLLPKALRHMTVPRAVAALATATSASGWTACTPVGEISTGMETGWPITLVDRSRPPGLPATVGANPNSPNAASFWLRVTPASAPARSAAATDGGRVCSARRRAAATDSNHPPAIRCS